MIKPIAAVLLVTLSVILPASGGTDGKWVVLDPENNILADNAQAMTGAGDYVWYFTEKEITRLNPTSLSKISFGYPEGSDVSMFQIDYYVLAADSDNVLLYQTYRSGKVYYLDNGLWKTLPLNRDPDSSGWVADMRAVFDGNGACWMLIDTTLLRYKGGRLDTVDVGFPVTDTLIGMAVANGNLYFIGTGASGGGGSTRTLYSFNNGSLQILSVAPESTWFSLYTSPTGTLYVRNSRQIGQLDSTNRLIWSDLPSSADLNDMMIDSDGNIWTFATLRVAGFVTTYSRETGAVLQGGIIGTFPPDMHAACRTGMFTSGRGGRVYWFEDNRIGGTYLCDAYGVHNMSTRYIAHLDNVLFLNNGTFMAVRPYNECSTAINKNASIRPIYELVDGRVVNAYYPDLSPPKAGLYFGTTPIPGSENLIISEITQDNKGAIWGIGEGKRIYHQKSDLWELIDSGNARIPALASEKIEHIKTQKCDGTVWLRLAASVAFTAEGYSWTTDSFTKEYPHHGRVLFMDNDSSGRMVVWFSAKDIGDGFTTAIRAVLAGGVWTYAEMNLPVNVTGRELYEDRYGERWIIGTSAVNNKTDTASLLYRYDGAAWTTFGASDLMDNFHYIIGEDVKGNMYFEGEKAFERTVRFTRNNLGVHHRAAGNNRAQTFTALHLQGKNLLLEYRSGVPDHLAISFFSPLGRCAAQYELGAVPAGTVRRILPTALPPGCYVVRMSTAAGVLVKKILLR
jgi:hypothetical protein